jgi:enoyl-CoA hydratase
MSKITLTPDQTTPEIGIITLDNPPFNTLSSEVLYGLETILEEARSSDFRVLVLTSNNDKVFSAGAEVKEILASMEKARAAGPEVLDKTAEIQTMLMNGHKIFRKIETFPIPIIAAISGTCLGGGTELALSCHMRVASQSSYIGLPEISLGIMPGLGGTFRLSRLIGRGKALEVILSGDPLDGKTACELGVVNKVVPAGKQLREAVLLARKFAAKSKVAVSNIIASFDADYDDAKWLADCRKELKGFVGCLMSEDGIEGIKAFFEKRKAKFTDK